MSERFVNVDPETPMLLPADVRQWVFSSRRIERATWHTVAVRHLTGDTNPDHDSIFAFRKNSG